MDIKLSKKCKNKIDFWQNYFFLESYNMELSENYDSTRDSKYSRNCMRANFMWFQKIVLYVAIFKWSDGLPIF